MVGESRLKLQLIYHGSAIIPLYLLVYSSLENCIKTKIFLFLTRVWVNLAFEPQLVSTPGPSVKISEFLRFSYQEKGEFDPHMHSLCSSQDPLYGLWRWVVLGWLCLILLQLNVFQWLFPFFPSWLFHFFFDIFMNPIFLYF